MSQTRKTPKYLAALIERHADFCDHVDELIRVKTTVPVENQAQHVRDGTPELWIGRAEGYWIALETALMAYGCYAGFMHVGPKKAQLNSDNTVSYSWTGVGPNDPEYREWRRHYFAHP